MMAAIVAKRLLEHLERSGFVVMKKPPIGSGATIGRGYDGHVSGGPDVYVIPNGAGPPLTALRWRKLSAPHT